MQSYVNRAARWATGRLILPEIYLCIQMDSLKVFEKCNKQYTRWQKALFFSALSASFRVLIIHYKKTWCNYGRTSVLIPVSGECSLLKLSQVAHCQICLLPGRRKWRSCRISLHAMFCVCLSRCVTDVPLRIRLTSCTTGQQLCNHTEHIYPSPQQWPSPEYLLTHYLCNSDTLIVYVISLDERASLISSELEGSSKEYWNFYIKQP